MFSRSLLHLLSLCVLLLVMHAGHLHAQTKKFGKATITEANGDIGTGKMRRGKKHGEWKTIAPNDTLIKTEHFERGVLHGPFIAYDRNGKLRQTRTYVNGHINGAAVSYLATGDTMVISTYRNDTLHGYYGEYRDWQNRRTEGYYVNGHKEGLWTAKNRVVGSVVQYDTMYYHNDSLDGVYRSYRDGYLFEEANYSNGALHGAYTKYHHGLGRLSEKAFYRNGLEDSVWNRFDRNGVLIQTFRYENGQWNGHDSSWQNINNERVLFVVVVGSAGKKTHEETWNLSGIAERRFFGDDARLDSSHTFSERGVIIRRRCSTQQPNLSPEFNFHEWNYDGKGRLISHGEMSFQVKKDKWMWYDTTGSLKKEFAYTNGMVQGPYTSYYPNGKIKVRGVCTKGRLDSIVVFSQNGRPLIKGTAQYKAVLDADLKDEREIVSMDRDTLPVEERWMPSENPNEVLTYAELMPMFPGDTVQAYLAKNIRYPQLEKETGKEGTVYVQFIVEKDGSITHVHTMKGVTGAPAFDKEAERVIRQMPKWHPGIMNGRAARVQIVQPVRFRLQ
jgi:TonB family protein